MFVFLLPAQCSPNVIAVQVFAENRTPHKAHIVSVAIGCPGGGTAADSPVTGLKLPPPPLTLLSHLAHVRATEPAVSAGFSISATSLFALSPRALSCWSTTDTRTPATGHSSADAEAKTARIHRNRNEHGQAQQGGREARGLRGTNKDHRPTGQELRSVLLLASHF